jgi:tetratricopeptide (TPR) repeat protein
MIHNNLGAEEPALSNASLAASLYESAGNKRGRARALSQVAQQQGKASRHDLASIAAERALELARELDDPALLAAVLARAANSASAEDMDKARRWFQESVELFRGESRDADAARTLQWWSGREMVDGLPSEAARIIDEALTLAASDLEMWTTSAAASIHWVLGNRERAVPLVRRALVLAGAAQHPVLLPAIIAYVALLASDPEEAARLYGYACSRSASDYQAPSEETLFREFREHLADALGHERLQRAMHEGSVWSYEFALARAQRI